MATEITLTRRTRAPKLTQLQADDGLWNILQELEGYLAQQDLRRLTVQQVADFVIALHSDATLAMENLEYIYIFDPALMQWKKVCIYEGKIHIPDGPVEDTIEVGFKVSASYE
jgi:hypothetical protein